MSNDRAFDGAVNDEVNADIGANRQGERVVRLDLTYTRGTAPVGTTMILTVDAAIALRNHLDGLFAASGIEDGDEDADDGLVDEADACPNCANRVEDELVWLEDGETVCCHNCNHCFKP